MPHAIMTIPHILKAGVVSFSKLVGILSSLGTMAMIGLFVIKTSNTKWNTAIVGAGIAIFCYAFLPETAIHAVSGMETALYTFLLISMAYLAFRGVNGSKSSLHWLPIAGLLNGLIRPEANILVIILLLITLLFTDNKRWFALQTLCFYIIPGGVYFAWRWLYYGLFLPLPFYIKTGGSGLPGLTYVQSFVIFIFVNFILYLGFSLFAKHRVQWDLLPIVVINLIFFLFVSPVMGYDFRFVYPVFPLILVLAGIGLALILDVPSRVIPNEKKAWIGVAWIGFISLSIFMWNNIPRTGPILEHKLDYAAGLINNHIKIGQALAQHKVDNPSPVLVVTDAGALPYYSGWITIDALGLNDPNIALGLVSGLDYIFDHNPDILILTSNNINTYQTDSVWYNSLYNTALVHGMEVILRSPFYRGDSIWVLGNPESQAVIGFSQWVETSFE